MRRNVSVRATIVSVLLAVEIVVVAAIVFAVAALAVGRFDRLSSAPPDAAGHGLPAPAVSAADVNGVRFDMAFRGYRMAEVDAVLARLADEIAWRDAELARRDEEMVRLASFAHFDHQSQGRRSADRDDWAGHADAVSQTTPPVPATLPTRAELPAPPSA
ncbi:DivIVA domain-containing protein [Frankia sp. Cr2]|uniref:DivIVA domain-containing protein n=1 Tax=Frankia sp. Cr2 TaxID=3073932 RepID=UPI002AD1FFA4|nr:DivIVA domain-containing protein [Frankia sp. Cr2]